MGNRDVETVTSAVSRKAFRRGTAEGTCDSVLRNQADR